MEIHLKYQMNRISFIAHNLKILLNLQTVAILIVTQFLSLVCVVKESLMILAWDLMIGNQTLFVVLHITWLLIFLYLIWFIICYSLLIVISVGVIISCLLSSILVLVCCFCSKCILYSVCYSKYQQNDTIACSKFLESVKNDQFINIALLNFS